MLAAQKNTTELHSQWLSVYRTSPRPFSLSYLSSWNEQSDTQRRPLTRVPQGYSSPATRGSSEGESGKDRDSSNTVSPRDRNCLPGQVSADQGEKRGQEMSLRMGFDSHRRWACDENEINPFVLHNDFSFTHCVKDSARYLPYHNSYLKAQNLKTLFAN